MSGVAVKSNRSAQAVAHLRRNLRVVALALALVFLTIAGCAPAPPAAEKPAIVRMSPDGTFVSQIVTAPMVAGGEGSMLGMHVRMQRTIEGTVGVGVRLLCNGGGSPALSDLGVTALAVDAGGRVMPLAPVRVEWKQPAGMSLPTQEATLTAALPTDTVAVRVIARCPAGLARVDQLVVEKSTADIPVVADIWEPWGTPPLPPRFPEGWME